MLKVGMVGVGCISGIYLHNIFNVFKDVELVAVCDLIRERAENAQKQYNIPKLYDTMEELFADPEIDIVLNLTRPYQHYAVSKAALLAGKHVYCEKPLGADLEEGIELVKLANEKGLYLGGAPDTFMGAGIQTCRKLIDDGLIGDVIGGRCVMASHGVESWHPDPDFYYQRGGGPLFDMGPYYITALINLLGGIKSVYGYAHTSYPTRLITADPHKGEIIEVNTPTHIESFLHFDSGITVSLLTSFDIFSTRQTNIEIYGTKGTLYVPDPNCFGGNLVLKNGEAGAATAIIFHNGETGKDETYPVTFDYAENSRCLGLDDIAVAIETGRPGRTTCKQTFHVLETMAGVLKSAESGLPYVMSSHFDREAPMDPCLPHGKL
ncbi:MAG: Gfo/Idh/MocA family oxidoreductase [Clostridia bacterium]|nr:Gfo/Idh/MocA family oxidoreductase [Clostridia bacterium]